MSLITLYKHLIITIFLLCISSVAYSAALPDSIIKQFPPEYTTLTFKSGDLNNDKKMDYIVVIHKKTEKQLADKNGKAPRRPLLIFFQENNGIFTLIARNDHVVYAINQGGQCDPFLDGEDGLALKGHFFTVQNAVACGNHWSDYITFKYSYKFKKILFHKRIYENWISNSSEDPDADALILGKHSVSSGKGKRILLQDYRPN